MKRHILQIETAIKSTFAPILETLNQRRSHFIDFEAEKHDSAHSPSQFLQMKKKQLIDLQEKFERWCNLLPVFGLNSAKYNINLFKSYPLPNIVNEQQIEPIFIKKANQFVSFIFANVQLLVILKFLGGATYLDWFLRRYQTSDTKGFFPCEWFNHPDKLNDKLVPPYEAFHNKLRNCNPRKKEYLDYEELIACGWTTESALVKFRLPETPPTKSENNFYLLKVWEQQKMQSFKDFLSSYNNTDDVPKLEAMQKKSSFITTNALR